LISVGALPAPAEGREGEGGKEKGRPSGFAPPPQKNFLVTPLTVKALLFEVRPHLQKLS